MVAWRTPSVEVIDGCRCGLGDGAELQLFGDGADECGR